MVDFRRLTEVGGLKHWNDAYDLLYQLDFSIMSYFKIKQTNLLCHKLFNEGLRIVLCT